VRRGEQAPLLRVVDDPVVLDAIDSADALAKRSLLGRGLEAAREVEAKRAARFLVSAK
jgi:hypothetical protein